MSVGFSKILHVEGADSFSSFVLQRFYQSDKGRAVKLISDYRVPLSILIYMGRVDSSLNAAKRRFICEYMQLIGADCRNTQDRHDDGEGTVQGGRAVHLQG